MVTALLPLKRNSERVKDKNFRDFAGKPLYRWMLDTLLASPSITQVIINTDAAELLGLLGLPDDPKVVVRTRQPKLCGDLVSMNAIIADDLQATAGDVYLMTHVTNPLLSTATIESALATFHAARAAGTHDSLFSANRVQARFYRADASPVNHDPAHLLRTQDLEPWFEENSNLYVFSRNSFARSHARIGERPLIFETPRFESIDIDDQADWDFALVGLQWLRGQRTGGLVT